MKSRRTLEPLGWPEQRLRACIDACEQHHALTSRWWMPNEVELVRRSDLVEVLPEPVRFAIPAVLAEAGAIAGGAPGRLLACHTRHHSGALAANAAGHVQATETWTVLHGGLAPKAWRGRVQKVAAAGVGALLAIVDVLGKVGVQ